MMMMTMMMTMMIMMMMMTRIEDGNVSGTTAVKYVLRFEKWRQILFLTMNIITTLSTQVL